MADSVFAQRFVAGLERRPAELLQPLCSTTLLAGHGRGVLRGNPFDLSTMRCLPIARVASHHAVLIQMRACRVDGSQDSDPLRAPLRVLRQRRVPAAPPRYAVSWPREPVVCELQTSEGQGAPTQRCHTCHQATNTADGFVPGLATQELAPCR